MMPVFAQALGIIAFATEAMSVQLRKRAHIVILLCIAAILFAISFYLLGAFAGAVTNLVSAFRALTFYLTRKQKPNPNSLIVFMLVFIIVGAVTWQGWLSILPVVGMLFTTYGMWQHNEQIMRKTFLFGSPFWLVYCLMTGSIGGVLNEFLNLLSTSIALRRYRYSTA